MVFFRKFWQDGAMDSKCSVWHTLVGPLKKGFQAEAISEIFSQTTGRQAKRSPARANYLLKTNIVSK